MAEDWGIELEDALSKGPQDWIVNACHVVSLVGRVHLCRPRQAVTKLPVTKSGGRPPIGEKAMTGAERMRKLRAGRRALTRTV